MTDKKQIAILIAKGLIETGVEGGYDNVCRSTAYDSICIGVSSWEQGRAQTLLSMIDGAEPFMNREYSDFTNRELDELSNLLDSESGQEAQLKLLASDCEDYIDACMEVGLTGIKSIVYAAMWMPTSTYVVQDFVESGFNEGYDMNDLEIIHDRFFESYANFADCSEYTEGYQNRADNTYEYCNEL